VDLYAKQRGACRPLAIPARPTAIVAGNDEQAAGVYTAAARGGLRVPHDLSVVGSDDVPMVKWASRALTTVRQPIAELAALAVRTLIGHLDDVALPRGRIELSTAFVVRGSTAPPPA
jgi:DNA-binding LacI/PurR family transcriptional regulator